MACWLPLKRPIPRRVKRLVESVRHLVIDQSLQIGVVPFSALSRQEIGGSNPSAVFRAELDGMCAFDDADVVQNLVVILYIALRGVTLRTNIQPQYIDFGVGEICELAGDGKSLAQTANRTDESRSSHEVADRPGVGEDHLTAIGGKMRL